MPARITHRQFYSRGGFSNPRQFRKMWGSEWTYWEM